MPAAKPKPIYSHHDLLKTVPANFPAELQALPLFCLWRYEYDGSRWTKVPYQLKQDKQGDHLHAKSNDRTTWSTLHDCIAIYIQEDDLDGIGCFIAEPYIGVDFDHVIKNGVIEPWAQEALKELNSYAELSPSGTGFHVWCKGTLPEGRRKVGRVEIYEVTRYFTVTGREVKP